MSPPIDRTPSHRGEADFPSRKLASPRASVAPSPVQTSAPPVHPTHEQWRAGVDPDGPADFGPTYMFRIMASPNSEHFTLVAPSISRWKS